MAPQRSWPIALAALAGAVVLSASAVAADTWNERTELTFSEPIMIPGVTLQPGTYVFTLAPGQSTRHMVQVYRSDGVELVAMTQAVPIRRQQPQGHTIVTVNPTDRGIPALKAWYYPHSSYGHEFIYPEEEARHIAERSKTIVLSVDVEDTDVERGMLRLYHPSGARTEWRPDADTAKEWEAWLRERAIVRTADAVQRADSRDDGDDGDARTASRAPVMMTTATGLRVTLDDLESNPSKYLGKTVSVDAEVEEVYGPRLFTIDEPHRGDLDDELLVYAPSTLAALVSDHDRVTITGTLQTVALTDIEEELGWFELDPEIDVDFLKKPVLVAERIVGGDDDVAMFIDMNRPQAADAHRPGARRVIMDPGLIGAGTSDLVGALVDLKHVRVLRMAHGGGFFVDLPGGAVLVLPSRMVPITVTPGQFVSLQGAVAEAPDRMAQRITPPAGWNDQIYVVAAMVSH